MKETILMYFLLECSINKIKEQEVYGSVVLHNKILLDTLVGSTEVFMLINSALKFVIYR